MLICKKKAEKCSIKVKRLNLYWGGWVAHALGASWGKIPLTCKKKKKRVTSKSSREKKKKGATVSSPKARGGECGDPYHRDPPNM